MKEGERRLRREGGRVSGWEGVPGQGRDGGEGVRRGGGRINHGRARSVDDPTRKIYDERPESVQVWRVFCLEMWLIRSSENAGGGREEEGKWGI